MPARAASEPARRADTAEQELRAASTQAKDAQEAAAAHRQAHADALIANAELQVRHTPSREDPTAVPS